MLIPFIILTILFSLSPPYVLVRVCVFHIKLTFSPICIKHNQCRCRCLLLLSYCVVERRALWSKTTRQIQIAIAIAASKVIW